MTQRSKSYTEEMEAFDAGYIAGLQHRARSFRILARAFVVLSAGFLVLSLHGSGLF